VASRRSRIQGYYSTPVALRKAAVLEQFGAGTTDPFAYRGEDVSESVITRTDLNGYGEWSRDRPIKERIDLLDSFFSSVVPLVQSHGGVYFRDEGDCIVALFSDYFRNGAEYATVEQFCMLASGLNFGVAGLTAKSVLVCGKVAFFQKAHERGTEDWSAEGEAFVRASRLEAAVPSGQRVAFFASDYDPIFAGKNLVATGRVAGWIVERKKEKVEGLGLPGGWADVVYLEKRA
jgi:hypothetical protein